MADKTFEQQMDDLEKIVNRLEQGDVPLEEALTQFKKGMKLSSELQQTLEEAEHTLAHVVDNQGHEQPFEAEDTDEEK